MRFLALSEIPTSMTEFVSGLDMPRYVIFALIILIYLIIGMFMDIIAGLALTIPVIYPVIQLLGLTLSGSV